MLIEIGMATVGVIGLLLIVYGPSWSRARQMDNALNGKYGEEVRWSAELTTEGDQLFTIALAELPHMEIEEAQIIAESKQDLRDRVVSRFEENVDESIPEDFAQ